MVSFGMKWLVHAFALIASCNPSGGQVLLSSSQGAQEIASFCVSKAGQRVGDGECWTLADQAFRAAGVTRPGGDLRVWGKKVDYRRATLEPGDVIEFRSAAFADGTVTGKNHTAVVVRKGHATNARIAEQNWGKKNVRVRELNLMSLKRGSLTVYRPISR